MIFRLGSRSNTRFCRMDVLPVLRSPTRTALLELLFSSPFARERRCCNSFSLLTKYAPVAGLPTMNGRPCNQQPLLCRNGCLYRHFSLYSSILLPMRKMHYFA